MRRHTADDDGGSAHVLEAVIIATIMVSAVSYVATFETPPASGSPSREGLKQRAQDILDGLYDTPVTGSSFGDNALSVFLAECMQGTCDNLTERLDRLLPNGAAYAMYVSNGYDTFPIYVVRDPDGEAVTATRLLEPKWSHSFVTTGTSTVNPTADSLVTYSLPIFNSNTLSQGGSPLRVIVHGVRTSDGANYTATGFFSTQAVATADAKLHPAVSAYFVVDGKPAGSWDATSKTLGATGLPSGNAVPFTLRVEETADVAVAPGAELTISLPRGWTASANQSWNNPNWLVLGNATSKNNAYTDSDIVARLLTPVKNGYVDFKFNATYHGDSLDWYPLHATLSKGPLSEANMLVRAAKGASSSTVFAIPQVAMSVPRPMGATATTTWTLTVDIPEKTDESVGFRTSVSKSGVTPNTNGGSSPEVNASAGPSSVRPSVIVHTIEIIEQDGASIFGQITPLTGSGTWENQHDRLVWNGSHSNTNGPLSLTFQVTGSGLPGAATSKNPFVPPAAFDGYKSRLISQVAPGFYRGAFLPDSVDGTYPGYSTADATTPGITHPVTSDAIFKSTYLPGSANYTLNPLTSFQDSVHGSYVNVERRNVPLGGTVVLSADVQSLLFALSQAGISAGVNLNFYPPWAGDTREPIWTEANLDAGILGSDVTKMMLMELNDDGYPDVLVGTSNGRVLALHGLTGARLQGGVFTAPLHATANTGAVTSITQLMPWTYQGQTYIVVGTDKEGGGVYVIDKNLDKKWSWDKPAYDVLSMATDVDLNNDSHVDIVVGLGNFGIYALSPDGDKLKPYLPYATPDGHLPDTFYTSIGPPTAMVGLQGAGPNASREGIAITFQSTPGVSATNVDLNNPLGDNTTIGFVTDLPRAGFQAIDETGNKTWTFFGSPVTTARAYDYDGDKITDVVGGSPAGFVYMMNGSTASQPLYSMLPYPAGLLIDGDAHSRFHSAFLTDEGHVRFTDTGWLRAGCPYCSPNANVPTQYFPSARAIALNDSFSFWLAGEKNLLLRSIPAPGFDDIWALIEGTEPEQREYPEYPYLAVVTPNATKNGEPNYFDTHQHDFNDMQFRWRPHHNEGWIVGGPCIIDPLKTEVCEESLVMRTLDGGHEWTIYSREAENLMGLDGDVVRAELTRINFTTAERGWILGTDGTLLRTTNGGAQWTSVLGPTEEDLLDISCAPQNPDVCILVSATAAWLTLNSDEEDEKFVEWAPLDLGFPEGIYKRALKSVGMTSTEVAYIGGENMVLKTYDGGQSWTTMPMNYLENDVNRISAFPDGTAYLFGGNVTNARYFVPHDYALSSAAQTTSLATSAENENFSYVEMDVEYSTFEGYALANFEVSANGGLSWQTMNDVGYESTVETEGDLHRYVKTYRYRLAIDPDNQGTDLRLRVVFQTRGDWTLHTALVGKMTVYPTTNHPTDPEGWIDLDPIVIDPTEDKYVDWEHTTATWDTHLGLIHQPLVKEYWTRNVSGEVRDIETGYDLNGDGRNEVWVGTGGVLASTAPEHTIYAGTDLNKWTRHDNRIYLLDGATGAILDRTDSFAGNVTNLAIGHDADDDGKPDYLYATTWDPVRGNGSIMGLDPSTLDVIWTVYPDLFQPSDLLAGLLDGPRSAPLLGTKASDTGQNAIPGKIYSFLGSDGTINWGAIPDQLGRYVITKDVPTNWFFGPYVVEVEVSWTNEIDADGDGLTPTQQVLQTARYYDYFLVTPPDALAPPSPVYQVHLVTWLKDWS